MTCALLSLVAAAPARAEDKVAAREHWERGTTYYDLGKYDDAIKEFEQAYEAKNDPAFLYNLAQSHRLAGHPAEALRFYRTYLRNDPKAPNRAYIEARVKDLEKTVAQLPSPEPPTSVLPPALAPAPAPATVIAGAPLPATTTGVPSAGVGASVSPPAPASDLHPPPPAPPPSASSSPFPVPSSTFPASPPGPEATSTPAGSNPPVPGWEPTPTARSSGRKTTGLVIGAVGGGLLVVGVVFGLVARSQSQKVESAAAAHSNFDPSVQGLGKTSEALQWVGYGLGLTAVAAGLVVYLMAPAPEAVAAPRVALEPMASHDLGGALLRVSF